MVVKHVNRKRRIRNNIYLLYDEDGHLINKDTDEAGTISAFSTYALCTDDGL